jgi:hypothetical protein
MRLYFFPFFASIFLSTFASCQQKDFKLSVEVSKKTVSVGELFDVKFILEGGGSADFVAPDWQAAGFLVRGTSQSSSYSFSNSTRSSTAEYLYQLMAQDTGWLEIPSAVVEIGGAREMTAPQAIHVLPADGNSDIPARSRGDEPPLPTRENKKKIKTIRL